MPDRKALLLATAAALLAAACAQPPAPPPEPDTAAMVAAADKLDQAFLEAFNKGDAEAMAALYWNSPDVVSFTPDALQTKGWTAIRDAGAAMFAAMQGAKLEVTESHQIPAGDMVIGWGLFRMAMPAPDGSTAEIVGRYTDVKTEKDGKWVYILDHASVPMPPPPAE